ncbi:hypothetical protein N0V83_006775 [Neocucurbitaria cava]|uniref:Ankyrin n=1 Tax=Neocucurbitaria cava TaxID=798079 RepID=A0A9W9CLK1_9PLEO|nr:hypothetical protein N0V83_006775 [Neocucurbitaria cava]
MADRDEIQNVETATSSVNKRDEPQQTTSPPSAQEFVPPQSDSDVLPLYSEEQPTTRDWLAELATTIRNETNSSLPVLAWPLAGDRHTYHEMEEFHQYRRIIKMYFEAIEIGNVGLVASFFGAGLVTTQTTNEAGGTPLLAAVEAEHTHMVRYLLDVGAAIDAYGVTATTVLHGKNNYPCTYRTPLQSAAQTGNLPIVRLLMGRGADDALIAPDGEVALRLAAGNGHREIVDYLPTRRGGGFKRWKTKHAEAMRRCKGAAVGIYWFGSVFVWYLPKFFLWTIPKELVVLPLVRGVKWLHEHRAEIPMLLVRTAKNVANGIKKFPARVWKVLKEIPRCIWDVFKECARFLWRIIKQLPHGIKTAFMLLWAGLKRIGLAVHNIVVRFTSFLHTICAAVLSFFQRITLRDVVDGFFYCIDAIIFDAPKKLWEWIYTLGKASLEALASVFWFWGFLARCMVEVVTYIPKKVWKMLVACGGSMKSGGQEVLVWFDPKRV